MTNNSLQRTALTHSDHHLTIKMLTKAFMADIMVLRKNVGLYDTYTWAFKDFVQALDTLLNA